MKVVQVWDEAGVAGTFAKYLMKYHNLDTPVYVRTVYDGHGIEDFYGATRISGRPALYVARIMMACRSADIIHVHNFTRVLSLLRKIYPRKKIIFHSHGGRSETMTFGQRKYELLADKLLLATNSLRYLDHHKPAEFLPNPVDLDHFGRRDIPRNNKGLIRAKPLTSRMRTDTWLQEHGYGGIDWTYYDLKTQAHPFARLPDRLAEFEYYGDIDMRYHSPAPYELYNMIGLQAMAVGCRTVCWDGIHEDVPPQHHPKVVTDRLMAIYRELAES